MPNCFKEFGWKKMKNFIEWTFKNGKMEDWNRVQKIYSWKNKVEISSNLVVQSTSKRKFKNSELNLHLHENQYPSFPSGYKPKSLTVSCQRRFSQTHHWAILTWIKMQESLYLTEASRNSNSNGLRHARRQ